MSFGIAPNRLQSKGFQQLVVSTAAVALTVPTGAARALITLEPTNGVRWRDDGTNPTAAVGMPLAGGATWECEAVLDAVRLIRSGAADATLNVAYYA